MKVHVSIHDVSPLWEREVAAALEETRRVGVLPALLVVPDFHRSADLRDHPRFVDSLLALQREGHPVYLHGFFHEAEPRSPDGMRSSLRYAWDQRVNSNREAEFSGLSAAEARRRIDEGSRLFTELGLRLDGFVAPAWCLPPPVVELLGERNFRYTEDRFFSYDPVKKTREASVVLNYASRSRARVLSTVGYCRVARHAGRWLPLRVAIHPGDVSVPLLRRELAGLLEWTASRTGRVQPAAR